MSYCRWSSDDWRCDFYIYEHTGGFVAVHIASNRVVGEVPTVDWELMQTNPDEWMRQHKAQMEFLSTAVREKIDHYAAGTTLYLDTLMEAMDFVARLRTEGLRMSDALFENLQQAALEEAQEDAETNEGALVQGQGSQLHVLPDVRPDSVQERGNAEGSPETL